MKGAKRAVAATIAVLALALILAAPARAQQITLGASTQNVTLLGGSGFLDLVLGSCSATTCTLSGTGFGPDGESGTYMFITTLGSDFPDFGPNSLGTFALASTDGTTTVFDFMDSDGDFNLMNVPVSYGEIVDNSPNPHFEFTTSLDLASDDFILNTLSCSGLPAHTACNADNVAAHTGAKGLAKVSGGEVLLPEPASLLLMGSGLLGLASVLRRKLL